MPELIAELRQRLYIDHLISMKQTVREPGEQGSYFNVCRHQVQVTQVALKCQKIRRVVQYCGPDSSRIPLPSIGKLEV